MTHPHLLLSAALFALCGAAAPAYGLDLGIDLPGLDVDVGIGGDGVGVSVGVGGVDLGPSVGGNGALPPDAVTLDHESALAAVRDEKALPLDDILKVADPLIEGEVIDAHLISYRGFLLYELRVLGTGGELADAYFYALSGRPVAGR